MNVLPTSQVRSTLQLMERSPNEPLTVGRRPRSVRAARRQGDPARLDRAAQLRLRRSRSKRRPAGPATRWRAIRRRRRRRPTCSPRVGAAAARIRERLGESIGSIQKFNVPGAERDHAVARRAEGVQHGHRDAPDRPATSRRFRSSSTRSSSTPTSRWPRRGSAPSTPTCAIFEQAQKYMKRRSRAATRSASPSASSSSPPTTTSSPAGSTMSSRPTGCGSARIRTTGCRTTTCRRPTRG